MTNKGDGYRMILCDDGGTLLGPNVEAPMGIALPADSMSSSDEGSKRGASKEGVSVETKRC